MSFRQTYYTSCQHGLRGGKGFQINAATEGIDPALLQQVERLGLYIPPVSAPSRPTEEEIARFPVSLLFQRLGDDTAVIAQARYTGADYSGRFGNYFTHALIPADAEADLTSEGLLPIEMWGSPTWVTRESPATTLPALDRLDAGGIIDPERVTLFLSERGRVARLPAFLTAIQGALATGRRIIIVEESESVALWIAAASYALPRNLALRLTFSTYSKNPYQSDFLVVGTTSDSDFGFAQHEIDHQFYVFDFAEGRFTTVGEATPFAQAVAAAYAAGAALDVAAFGAFAERAAPDLRLEELDAAFAFHAMRRRLPSPAADDVRLLDWCGARLGGLDAREVCEVVGQVVGDGSRGDVLGAYTSLYLAALDDSMTPETRAQIELPYLQWLVKTAAAAAPLADFERASGRLRVRSAARPAAAPLVLPWVRQVRQCADVRRLPAMFEVADKLGFFDAHEESLSIVGEEVIGPALAEAPTGQILRRLAGTPGMKGIISGVGAYLAAQVSSPVPFRPLADLLASEEVYRAFVGYALDQQSPALYFRLVGARLPRVPTQPGQRLEAFKDCVSGLRRMAPALPGELVDNAYEAIWQDSLPTFDEATSLLDLIEGFRIKGTAIPRLLADLVATCELAAPDRRQEELINRLGARGPFYGMLGEKGAIIDAYRIPAELEMSGDELAQEINGSLKFLRSHPELGDRIATSAYAVIAGHLSRVKDQERHARLLVRGYEDAGGDFLSAYGRAVVAALEKPSSTRPKVAARFAQVWTSVDRGGAKFVAATLFGEYLGRAVVKWRGRELEAVEDELSKDPPALHRWIASREAAKAQAGSAKGLFGKLGKLVRSDRGAGEER